LSAAAHIAIAACLDRERRVTQIEPKLEELKRVLLVGRGGVRDPESEHSVERPELLRTPDRAPMAT
jgi:hypothetical protein